MGQRNEMLWRSFKKMTEITRRRPHPTLAGISDLLCTQRALTFCLDKNNLPVSISYKPISTLNAMNWYHCQPNSFTERRILLDEVWNNTELRLNFNRVFASSLNKCFYFCLGFLFDIFYYLASLNRSTLFTFFNRLLPIWFVSTWPYQALLLSYRFK